MRTSALLILLALSAAPVACTDPHYSRLEDAGDPEVPPPDTVRPSDVRIDPLVCELDGATVCTPSTCPSVCHARTGGATAGAACTVSFGTQRYDDCTAGNVCLTDGFGASHCFALCRNRDDCLGGRACTARKLSGDTLIRACDPEYRNCSSVSEPCCDPLAKAGCGAGQYCYLVSPQPGSEDSWTICDYETGVAAVGHPCISSRDCLHGLACFLSTPSSSAGECRQVCNPATPGACAPGTCTPYGNQWGICSP